MSEKDTAEKKAKESKVCIIWDGALLTETVIMTILAVAFIGGGFFLYFFNFNFSAEIEGAVGEFTASGADLTSTIKLFCAPLIISGLSYLLFFAFRVLEFDHKKWLKAVLCLVYLGFVAVILYFNRYNCEAWFNAVDDRHVMTQVIRHILWANSVSCGVFFLLYYTVLVHVRD